MGPSYQHGIVHIVPAKAKVLGVIFWPYNKSFIDQACSVKMTGYWPRSFLRCYGQYPAILTSRLVNNAYIFVNKLSIIGCAIHFMFCLLVSSFECCKSSSAV